MQAYIRFPQAAGAFRYWPYDGSAFSVAEASAVFALLTYDQRVASSTPNQPALATGFDRWKIRSTVVVDPEPDGLAYAPRTLLGTHNGYPVYSGTGINFLLEVYGSNPDTFAPKGGNLTGIVFAPGMSLPSGLVDTDFNGQAPPSDYTRFTGYRLRYFSGHEDQKYWEKSTLADEVLDTGGGTVDPPNPATPAATASGGANSDVLTLAIENNGTKWRIRKTSTHDIPGGSQEFFYINGEKKSGFGSYDYLPGDQVSVLYIIATDTNTNNWTTKGYQLITFGHI